MKVDTNQTVEDILGGPIRLSIPFVSALSTPTSLLTWIIAILAIMPYIIWVVCIVVIIINAIKWVKSSGNEKEVESAQAGMKRAIVGFASMFILFIIANVMSYFFIGTSFDRLVGALGLCENDKYVFQYARDNNMDLDKAFNYCQSNSNYKTGTGGFGK